MLIQNYDVLVTSDQVFRSKRDEGGFFEHGTSKAAVSIFSFLPYCHLIYFCCFSYTSNFWHRISVQDLSQPVLQTCSDCTKDLCTSRLTSKVKLS